MKTYEARPTLDADLMLKLEHTESSYMTPEGIDPPKLLAMWEKEIGQPSGLFDLNELDTIRTFGSWFMFECGRVYGIQQERMRRKARSSTADR